MYQVKHEIHLPTSTGGPPVRITVSSPTKASGLVGPQLGMVRAVLLRREPWVPGEKISGRSPEIIQDLLLYIRAALNV